jgi:hypothetical protein
VRSTVQKLTPDELQSENVRHTITENDAEIESRLRDLGSGDRINVSSKVLFDVYTNGDDEPSEPMEKEADQPKADAFDTATYDQYIAAEVMLPQGDVLVPAKVVGRKHDANGNPVGVGNSNPLLDSRVYNVEFPDGHIDEYAANIIAENIYSQVDSEGITFSYWMKSSPIAAMTLL